MVYLSIGTNLGRRRQNMRRAMAEIESRIGHIVSRSGLFTTEPWGFSSPHAFLNACVAVDTPLSPRQLLDATQAIERDMGRTEKTRPSERPAYHDRVIDIDILLYGDRTVSQPRLRIPHPRIAERLFVLRPLAQIAPSLSVPGSSMSVGEMLRTLETAS